jgi:hypothetical protein
VWRIAFLGAGSFPLHSPHNPRRPCLPSAHSTRPPLAHALAIPTQLCLPPPPPSLSLPLPPPVLLGILPSAASHGEAPFLRESPASSLSSHRVLFSSFPPPLKRLPPHICLRAPPRLGAVTAPHSRPYSPSFPTQASLPASLLSNVQSWKEMHPAPIFFLHLLGEDEAVAQLLAVNEEGGEGGMEEGLRAWLPPLQAALAR